MLAENLSSEHMSEDLSILQQSLQTAFVGFQEAKRAFEDGTDEVRRLLLYECSLVYECNVCRNLFRSLANFISHKRAFCCKQVVSNLRKGFTDSNSAVIIQATDAEAVKRSRSTGSSPLPDGRRVKGSTRDICSVIERLKREKPENTDRSQDETVLQLECVPTSTNAVYQTIKRLEADSIKTEIDEVHSLLTNVKTVVGPDGKALTRHTYGSNDRVANSANENLGNLGFKTEKTLQIHMQKKHIDSTYVYQCPACSITFLKSAHVIRHLANEHKKSPRRIRMMREGIMKRRMQQCDVQVKGPNRELKRLQIDGDDKNIGLQSNGKTSKWKVLSSCLYCDVKFERRAALSAHLLKCTAKMEAKKKPCQSAGNSSTIANLFTNLENLTGQECSNVSLTQAIETDALKQEIPDANELNEMFENLQTQNCIGLQTISLERLELSDSNDSIPSCATHNTSIHSEQKSIKSEPLDSMEEMPQAATDIEIKKEIVEEEEEADEMISKKSKTKIKGITPGGKLTTCRCKICNKQFNEVSNLKRHISMYHYRARRFGCKMCDYHAFRIYDIVNHLTFVHKMTETREILAKEYVDRHELTYSKKDTEGDILLVSEIMNVATENLLATTAIKEELVDEVPEEKPKLIKTYEKRKSAENNLKSTEVSTSVGIPKKLAKDAIDVKVTRKNLKRATCSQQPVVVKSETFKQIDKRPMRKRVKALNNDFVYDLSTLLKKDMPLPEREGTTTRVMRRHLSVAATAAREAACEMAIIPKIELEQVNMPPLPLVNLANKDSIKTATQRVLRQVVHEARAALSTMPELPTERPQMRPRLTSTYQDEIQAGPIIEANDLEAARRKATLLDDAFLDKFTRRNSSSSFGTTFKIKPCLEVQHDTLSTLLEKMDTTIQNKNAAAALVLSNAIVNDKLCENTTSLLQCAVENESTVFEMSTATATSATVGDIATVKVDLKTPNGKLCTETNKTIPPTPRKRFTLLQHLAENKQRKLDSLLRTALQN